MSGVSSDLERRHHPRPRHALAQVIFITASISIVYIIRFGVPHKDTYNKEDDAFPSQYAVLPSRVLAVTPLVVSLDVPNS